MMDNLNRRSVLSAVALGSVALGMPAVAAAARAADHDPEWDRLLAAFEHADAEMAALGTEHTRATTLYFEGRKLLGDEPQPPKVVYPRPLTDMTIGELRELEVPADELARYKADLAAWKARDAELEERTSGKVERLWTAAVDAQDKAAHAILAYPAPSQAALLYKLDLLERVYRGCDMDEDAARLVHDDVRRFLREKA